MKKIILTVLMMLSLTAISRAEGLDSPLSVEIKMKKTAYGPQEELDGMVVITNKSSQSFPAIFDIKLFHDDILQDEVRAAIQSFLPGDNKYNFKELGIPRTHPDGGGRWRLVIMQKDVDASNAASADFLVLSQGGDAPGSVAH